jgi:alpha-mannosidase
MYFMLQRIQKICNELKSLVYSDRVAIDDYKMHEGNFLGLEEVEKVKEGWKDFKTGDLWGGRDYHCWFKTQVTVPKAFAGKTAALNFYTFKEGWDAINPQFILYLDGEHIQGIDINHREIILSDCAESGKTYNIDLHAYSGLAQRKAVFHGELVLINKAVRELYFNLQVPVWVCEKLDDNDKRRIDMLSVLNEAVNLLNLRQPNSQDFYKTVDMANEYLRTEFYEKLCGQEDVIATCVGHTHIDIAWHWTVAQTREKAGRSFSTVLKLMEQYPEYIFMSSQPQLYKFIKEDYPEVYKKIKQKVKEGAWEPEGAMWLEADCNVTSGESLVRQILFGKRFFKDEFGIESEILWLPDVFGYSAALPQILKKADINYFMTTKLGWNQFNKIPHDTFMWKGIDGTEVLTHFITTKDPYQDPKSHYTTYNGQIHPGAIMGAWDRYQQKEINNEVLVSFGFGDGGGGATYEMLEVGRRLNKGIPGCPKVEMGRSKDYFKRLEAKVKGHKRLPKWVGELYLEYHRGTYTSMARNKRDNRKSENLYMSVEKASSLAMLFNKPYPGQQLSKGWENILLNQFHDILPGSSIKEVYEVTKEEYEKIIVNGEKILDDSIKYISSQIKLDKKSVVVFNTLSFMRDDIASFEIPEGIVNPVLEDENGQETVCQVVENNKAIFFAKGVPANGYKAYYVSEAKDVSIDIVDIDTKQVENQFFKIQFNDKAEIKSFYDKKNSRELIKAGEVANALQAFEDKPLDYDNWDIEIYYSEKMWPVDNLQTVEVIERGPVRSTLRIERKFDNSIIIQKLHIYRDIPRIDFNTYIDWKNHQVLLKTAFPIDINVNKATYEIQYGNVERPTHSNTSWDMAKFEVCAQKWADISEGDFGVSLLNDCKYGHDIKEGVMRLTLLKSGIVPNPATDQEEHFFNYSIYPHSGDWKDSKTVQMAYNLNVPLYTTVEKAHGGNLDRELSMAKIDKDNVVIEVIKKAEDSGDLIIRLYECHNKRSTVTLELFRDIFKAYECNLLEENLEEVQHSNNKISFHVKPYEIKTFKLTLV